MGAALRSVQAPAMNHDVVVVGGGPAGLSAALLLGRARKRVLLCDAGTPRNAHAVGVHNFVTRDGISPRDFRAAARADLLAYPSVETRDARVVDVVPEVSEATGERLLRVTLEDGESTLARRVLLATGVVDVPAEIPGLHECWGKTAFQCPYCHGWEVRDRPWGVLATSDETAAWSLVLLGWTSTLAVFTDGRPLAADIAAQLTQAGARVVTDKIARVAPGIDPSGHVALITGEQVPCDALFAHPAQRPTALVTRLGLALDPKGYVTVVEPSKESSMPGVHVVGDASTMMQAAIVAAGAGTMGAAVINHALTLEDLKRRVNVGTR